MVITSEEGLMLEYDSNAIMRGFDKASAANEAYSRELRVEETDDYGSETNSGKSRPDLEIGIILRYGDQILWPSTESSMPNLSSRRRP